MMRGIKQPTEGANEALLQQANLESHLAFATEVLGRTPLPEAEKAQRLHSVQRIRDKHNARDLILGVIGEFSSGKSTFINALLRDPLLETGVLQGTTNASCIIRHGEQYGLSIAFPDGRTEACFARGEVPTREAIMRELNRITQDDVLARTMDHIILEHPSPSLDPLVIIDTPGTNSQKRWHEDVTVAALREQADAAIILTHADKPMPESLLAFLEEQLSGIISKCIVVVTRFDLIRREERAATLQYVQRRMMDMFDIDAPLVLPYAAPVVLGETERIARHADDPALVEELRALSFASEARVMDTLMANKISIQLQKTMALLDTLYSDLRDTMARQLAAYEAERQAVERDKIPDIDRFLELEVIRARQAMQQGAQRRSVNRQAILIALDRVKSEIHAQFNRIIDKRTLVQYARNIAGRIERAAEAVAASELSDSFARSREATERVWRAFFSTFHEKYRRLQIHVDPGALQAFDATYQDLSLDVSISLLPGLADMAAQYNNIGNITQYIPFVDSIFNLAFGTVNSMRTRLWNEMVQVIDRSLPDIADIIYCKAQDYDRMATEHVCEQILSCKAQYNALIDTITRQDRNAVGTLTDQKRVIQADMENLESRGQRIRGFREQLGRVGLA